MTTGIIKQITDQKIFVEVVCLEACAQCAQEKQCALSHASTKLIELPYPKNQTYSVNDKVKLEIDNVSICKSLFFAYAFPLLLMLLTLLIGHHFGYSEKMCANMSLAILPIYYLFLKLLNPWLKKSVNIKIKQNSVD